MTNKDSHTPDGRKPQAYRNTETGTIAYINRPYKDWVSIAPVLDVVCNTSGESDTTFYYNHPVFIDHNSSLGYWLKLDRCFPVTITGLPDTWIPVSQASLSDDVVPVDIKYLKKKLREAFELPEPKPNEEVREKINAVMVEMMLDSRVVKMLESLREMDQQEPQQ